MKKKAYNKLNSLKGNLKKLAFSFFTVFCTLSLSATLFASSNPVGEAVNELNSGSGVFETIRNLINIMAWLGFMIAIFKVIQIGIMFLMSAGNKRSDAKSALIPWLVGAAVCVLFGTVGPMIINLIMGDSGNNIFDI